MRFRKCKKKERTCDESRAACRKQMRSDRRGRRATSAHKSSTHEDFAGPRKNRSATRFAAFAQIHLRKHEPRARKRSPTHASSSKAPKMHWKTLPLSQKSRNVSESSASTTCQSFRKADITHYLEIWALKIGVFRKNGLPLIRFAQYASLKMPPGAFLSPKRPKARLRDT